MRLAGMNKGVERVYLSVDRSEPLMRCREVRTPSQKLRSMTRSEKVELVITLITAETYLLAVGLASFRWQELYSGLFTELGKPVSPC